MQNAHKRCTTHPSQQSTYVDSLGRSRQEIGTIFFGGGNRKGSMWRQLSEDHFISTQSIPNLPYSHPSAEKGPEPIPHVSWKWGCAIGAMVIMFIDDEKEDC